MNRQLLSARDAYRFWAPTYNVENPVTVLEQSAVRMLSPSVTGLALLDAACGTGRRLPRARGRGPRCVVGIDLVFEMLVQARLRRQDLTDSGGPQRRAARNAPVFIAADVRALPCPDRSFDVIWCRLAVGHVPELDPVYAELTRVACPGAHIVMTDFHPAAAKAGHVRSFRDGSGVLRNIEHYIHEPDEHLRAAQRVGLRPVARLEPVVGRAVRRFYSAANRLDAYEEQRGLPLVLALAFRA